MSKHIANYVGISSFTEKSQGNRGIWSIFDQLYFIGRGSWKSVIQATGGSVTDVDGYRYHEFTTPGTFDVSSASFGAEIEVLSQGGGNTGARGNGFGGSNQPGGSGGGGGATGVWRLQNIPSGTFPVSVGGAGSGSSLNGTNPASPQFVFSGAGGGSNSSSWPIATSISSFPGTSGSGPSGFGGGPGGSAGGTPQPSALWWKPFMAPGGGGSGGGHTGSGFPGSPRGGGGGGGGGSGDSPNASGGPGGIGAPGVVVIRYQL
jgi:hypothetical protein